MSSNRRDFLRAAVGAALGLVSLSLSQRRPRPKVLTPIGCPPVYPPRQYNCRCGWCTEFGIVTPIVEYKGTLGRVS